MNDWKNQWVWLRINKLKGFQNLLSFAPDWSFRDTDPEDLPEAACLLAYVIRAKMAVDIDQSAVKALLREVVYRINQEERRERTTS